MMTIMMIMMMMMMMLLQSPHDHNFYLPAAVSGAVKYVATAAA